MAVDAAQMQAVVQRAATDLARVYDQVRSAAATYTDLGLTLDADHTAAALALATFVNFMEGQAVAADAARRAKLNKVRIVSISTTAF